MLLFGSYLRFMSRRQLMGAGLTMLGSSRLVAVEASASSRTASTGA